MRFFCMYVSVMFVCGVWGSKKEDCTAVGVAYRTMWRRWRSHPRAVFWFLGVGAFLSSRLGFGQGELRMVSEVDVRFKNDRCC